MSGEDAAILAELLCARLCHDLAGAIGAVGTGVELLADENDGQEFAADALSLLATSAAAAVQRLKFLRMALGSGGAAMSSGQIHSLIADFFGSQMDGSEGLRLAWNDIEKRDWDCDLAKLLLNLVLMARDCLPRGGVVTIEMMTANTRYGARGAGDGGRGRQGTSGFGCRRT
jgi:histidine phosphotransferase ChpT